MRIEVAPGPYEVTTIKNGFVPLTTAITVGAGQLQRVSIELQKAPVIMETVTVSATRTNRGLEDQPVRVEALDAEEIDERLMMTPGDVVMMLNEMGGMRVQATSPSLGAASIRIQGMRGRDTRFLSDGLPLFGEQVSLGLMQIPPLDLATLHSASERGTREFEIALRTAVEACEAPQLRVLTILECRFGQARTGPGEVGIARRILATAGRQGRDLSSARAR